MFLNRLPFVALLFCLLAFEFYFSFPKMKFFFNSFSLIHVCEHYFSSCLVYADDCSPFVCMCVFTAGCVRVAVCRRILLSLKVEQSFGPYTLPSHTMTTLCILLYTDRHTRKSIHAHKHTHTRTLANDLLPCVCCLHSFVSFVFIVLIASQRHVLRRASEWTSERTNECAHTHVNVYVCTVCSFYCCQFSCPFHSLVIRINNICALRSKYIIIYIMITFARCWCAWALYVRMCVRRFFSQYSLILIPFHIYIPVDITCGSGFTFRYSFSLFQAVNHCIG